LFDRPGRNFRQSRKKVEAPANAWIAGAPYVTKPADLSGPTKPYPAIRVGWVKADKSLWFFVSNAGARRHAGRNSPCIFAEQLGCDRRRAERLSQTAKLSAIVWASGRRLILRGAGS
jgi:hypothetical protein